MLEFYDFQKTQLRLLKNETDRVTERRIKVEEESFAMLQCGVSFAKVGQVAKDNVCRTLLKPAPVPPVQCHTPTFTKTNEDDYFTAIFEQLIKS